MKKILSILLVMLLVAAILPTAALAANVQMSTQNLRVDGKRIECEKYNIDDSNYFKLRDIAYALNGTGSQFSVTWDGEKKLISLVRGEAYEPVGGELDLAAGDKSDRAQPSADAILIDSAYVAPFIAAPMLIVLIAGVFIGNRKKKKAEGGIK